MNLTHKMEPWIHISVFTLKCKILFITTFAYQLVALSNFVTDNRIKPILIFLKRAIKIAVVHFFVLIAWLV